MLAIGLAGFVLVVWGPRRHIFTSGYKGNPTSWAVWVGFILLVSSAVGPVLITKLQQVPLPGPTQSVGGGTETNQTLEAVTEKPAPTVAIKNSALATDINKDVTNAIEVCETITSFFSKNSCRFEQCEKQENLAKPECENFLKK